MEGQDDFVDLLGLRKKKKKRGGGGGGLFGGYLLCMALSMLVFVCFLSSSHLMEKSMD